MVDAIDQHADADNIGGQDEFLPLVSRALAGACQPLDRGQPFLLARLNVADEGVQMLDHGLHDPVQPRVWHRTPSLQNNISDVLFGHVGHGSS